jgi:hypothetical protein
MEKLYNSNSILVNETFIVDHKVNDLWLQWFNEKFISTLSTSERVNNIVFSRINHEFNPDGISYALQFKLEKNDLDLVFGDERISEVRTTMFNLFSGNIASFRTEMEILKIF